MDGGLEFKSYSNEPAAPPEFFNLAVFEQWRVICFGAGANPRLLSPSNSPYTLTHLKMISVMVPPSRKAKAIEA
tara:strand:- start:3520 stop:3741 length:222 start_codon:yes stop_codon:yes gene_type:complete